jgi:hypothetical protein
LKQQSFYFFTRFIFFFRVFARNEKDKLKEAVLKKLTKEEIEALGIWI